MTSDIHSANDTDRRDRITAVVDGVVLRRSGGCALSDQQVIADHPDLMPELAERLRTLGRIEVAQRYAESAERASGSRGSGSAGDTATQIAADAIPGFELTGKVHRGAQGVVYRAIQTATGRDVAIKVIRGGPLVGPRDQARFEREVRALGQIQHPNIVTIHDSGKVAGLHYLVMDYVEGLPLDTYMAMGRRPIDETLRLFVTICDAIHAAHLRGVIHRDLKPSNIRIDGRGEPHILDFGLAKLATEESGFETQTRQLTMTGQFVGSLPWSSPEQAEGIPDRIDLRTDIYSLGVILYQMITGELPYTVSGGMSEAIRQIVEREPVRPRSHISNLDEDVETIILKCLAKERERRYQSVIAIAEDIRRYLARQPILARAPSTTYQLKKLIARHKLSSVLIATLLVVLVGFAAWMSVLRTEAELQAHTATAINEFLINDMLAAATPAVARGRDVTVAAVLDSAATRVDAAFADEPLVEASIRFVIGRSYLDLGLFGSALPHLVAARRVRTRELGNEHPATLRVANALADLYFCRGEFVEANNLAAETLELARAHLGASHEVTLDAAYRYARALRELGHHLESERLHLETLERRRRVLGPEHPQTIESMIQWGYLAYTMRGKTSETETFLRSALETSRRVLGDTHPGTLLAMSNLGVALGDRRKILSGEALLRTAVEGQRSVLGAEHPDTLRSTVQLAALLLERARNDEAEEMLREAMASTIAVLGDTHPVTFASALYLGKALWRQGKYTSAVPLLRQAVDVSRRLYGSSHVEAAFAVDCLGYVLGKLGRYAEAERLHRSTLDLTQDVRFGRTPTTAAWSLRCLAETLAAQGKKDEALAFATQVLELRRTAAQQPNADAYTLNCYARALLSPELGRSRKPREALKVALSAYDLSTDEYHYNRYTLARAYRANGQQQQAIAMLLRALAHTPIEVSEDRVQYESELARLYDEVGNADAGEKLYLATLAARRDRFSDTHEDVAASLFDLGRWRLNHGDPEGGETALRDSNEILRTLQSESKDHMDQKALECRVASISTYLAESLVAQGRFEEAKKSVVDVPTSLAGANLCDASDLRHAREILSVVSEHSGSPPGTAGSLGEPVIEPTPQPPADLSHPGDI